MKRGKPKHLPLQPDAAAWRWWRSVGELSFCSSPRSSSLWPLVSFLVSLFCCFWFLSLSVSLSSLRLPPVFCSLFSLFFVLFLVRKNPSPFVFLPFPLPFKGFPAAYIPRTMIRPRDIVLRSDWGTNSRAHAGLLVAVSSAC